MSTYYTTLEHEALLHITGPDALTFLQGQVTCDTRLVDSEHAQLGAYCTPQGRVVCDFLLCQLGEEHYAMRLRRDTLDSSAATFGKYIVFSKAALDTERKDWRLLACWGPDAAASLQAIFGKTPGAALTAQHGEGFSLIQIDEHAEQFECYLDSIRHAQALEQISATMEATSEARWQALQIQRGLGRVEAATVGEFIPQMLNYDLTGHISFKKGCYTGQEVVARMHYRGKPKRRMYLAELPSSEPLAAGTALYSDGTAQSVGNVVNSAGRVGEPALALVVATAAATESGLHPGSADEPALTLAALPYSVTTG